MTTHKRDVDLARCDELHKKIQEYKQKLDDAYKAFEAGTITAGVAQKAAELYGGALLEYENHCGSKKIR